MTIYSTYEKHDFVFRIETEHEFVDLGFLGHYTDREPDKRFFVDRKLNGDQGWHEYRYWVPANDPYKNRKYYQKHGYSRHEAWETAKSETLQDYRLSEQYNNGSESLTFVSVKIKYNRRTIGSASMGSVGNDDESIQDAANDLWHDAAYEALQFLKGIGGQDSKVYKTLDRIYRAWQKIERKNRRTYRPTFKGWRDLSHAYQNGRTVTRHTKSRWQNTYSWRHSGHGLQQSTFIEFMQKYY